MVRMGAILVAGLAATAGSLALASAGWASPRLVSVIGGATVLGWGVVIALGSARPGWQLFGPAITRAETGRAEVALTFDDGPDPTSTPSLLAALEQAGARGTFFLLADRVEQHPDLARAIATGHEVGLHGASHHPWLTLRSPAAGAAELRDAARRVEAITGSRPTLFRPPFGATSPRLAEAARLAGLTTAWCSLRTGDGGSLSAEVLRQRCRAARPGDVVLLHEGPRAAREALPHILSDLGSRGLRAVTLTELLA